MTGRFIYLYTLVFFLFTNSIYTQTITAINNTNWSLSSTWDLNRIPALGDTVIINGKNVTLDVSATVAEIRISNTTPAKSQLKVDGGGVILNVTNDMTILGTKENHDVDLEIKSTDSIYIAGTLTITRESDNETTKRVRLKMSADSKLTIGGDLVYNYNSSAASEAQNEFEIIDNAQLNVEGITTFNATGGEHFLFEAEGNSIINFKNGFYGNYSNGLSFSLRINGNPTMTVDGDFSLTNASTSPQIVYIGPSGGMLDIKGDLNLHSTSTTGGVAVVISGASSSLIIRDDINFQAISQSNATIFTQTNSSVYLGGNINRSPTNNYGKIEMDANTNWHYNGDGAQTISGDEDINNGTDFFKFANVYIDNSVGPITLEGLLTVTDELILNSAIIKSTETNPIIIDHNATISGGSKSAYIDGPLIKRGSTNNARFTFPIGNNGIYAPITIEEITDANLEYTALYMGCPPPTLAVLNSPLQSINQQGFWSLERNDAAAVGNISLHWNDASVIGITDTASLVVAYYLAATGWHSLGRSNSILEAGTGASGSIKNDIGCPPPTLTTIFGLGSTDINENVLPVELTSFRAFRHDDDLKVNIEWETVSEVNSDYFIIEKSYDGISFHEIDRIPAAQNSNITQRYRSFDNNPAKGNNYYRLQQVDQDQVISFSNLINIFININHENGPVIYPNPVKDQLKLYNKSFQNNDQIPILIFNQSGQSIYRNIHQVQNGQLILSTQQLNIKEPGIYFISFISNDQAYSMELIKAP